MAYEYMIHAGNEQNVKEPTKGKWYAGFYYDAEIGAYLTGLIAEYVGCGEFYEEDDDGVEVNMRGYEFLVEQV